MTEMVEVEDLGSNIGDYDIPIHNAIIIPRGATNGDMIKAIFPNAKVNDSDYTYCVEVKLEYHSQYLLFDKKWWNAPYKGNLSEFPTGSESEGK